MLDCEAKSLMRLTTEASLMVMIVPCGLSYSLPTGSETTGT